NAKGRARLCTLHSALCTALALWHLSLSWMMDWRQQGASPEGQQHENETADCAQGKAATALRKFPAHDYQAQVQQPDHCRPNDFRIHVLSIMSIDLNEVVGADS